MAWERDAARDNIEMLIQLLEEAEETREKLNQDIKELGIGIGLLFGMNSDQSDQVQGKVVETQEQLKQIAARNKELRNYLEEWWRNV